MRCSSVPTEPRWCRSTSNPRKARSCASRSWRSDTCTPFASFAGGARASTLPGGHMPDRGPRQPTSASAVTAEEPGLDVSRFDAPAEAIETVIRLARTASMDVGRRRVPGKPGRQEDLLLRRRRHLELRRQRPRRLGLRPDGALRRLHRARRPARSSGRRSHRQVKSSAPAGARERCARAEHDEAQIARLAARSQRTRNPATSPSARDRAASSRRASPKAGTAGEPAVGARLRHRAARDPGSAPPRARRRATPGPR